MINYDIVYDFVNLVKYFFNYHFYRDISRCTYIFVVSKTLNTFFGSSTFWGYVGGVGLFEDAGVSAGAAVGFVASGVGGQVGSRIGGDGCGVRSDVGDVGAACAA